MGAKANSQDNCPNQVISLTLPAVDFLADGLCDALDLSGNR